MPTDPRERRAVLAFLDLSVVLTAAACAVTLLLLVVLRRRWPRHGRSDA